MLAMETERRSTTKNGGYVNQVEDADWTLSRLSHAEHH